MEPRMRIAYMLGEADLSAVLLQQSLWRRERVRAWLERIRGGPFWRHSLLNLVPGTLFGVLLYPLWTWLIAGTCRPSAPTGIYAVAVAVAVPMATVVQRWTPPPRLHLAALYRASARRRLGQALRKSVLGEVQIVVEESGLLRINSTGELRIPWSEVVALLDSPSLLTVVLARNRVIAAPRRAFATADEAVAFRQELERRSAKRALSMPDAP